VAEWNRRKAMEAEMTNKARRVGVNKESAVSSTDKELAVQEEEGTGALHLHLALEGNKNKESKSKELGRPSSFKRGKDVVFPPGSGLNSCRRTYSFIMGPCFRGDGGPHVVVIDSLIGGSH
jgi:hypothetical protein